MKKRRVHSSGYKFKVALEALRGQLTVAELCQKHSVHSSQIQKWKKHLQDSGSSVFTEGLSKKDSVESAAIDALRAKVGELLMERDFLKKALAD